MGDPRGGPVVGVASAVGALLAINSETAAPPSGVGTGVLLAYAAQYPLWSTHANEFDQVQYNLIGTIGNVRVYQVTNADVVVFYPAYEDDGSGSYTLGVQGTYIDQWDVTSTYTIAVNNPNETSTNYALPPLQGVYFMTVTPEPLPTTPRRIGWEYMAAIVGGLPTNLTLQQALARLLDEHYPDRLIMVHGQWAVDNGFGGYAIVAAEDDRRGERCQ